MICTYELETKITLVRNSIWLFKDKFKFEQAIIIIYVIKWNIKNCIIIQDFALLGCAGCGKSYLINNIKKSCRKDSIKIKTFLSNISNNKDATIIMWWFK